MRVLVVGCGYIGQPLAETLARQGHEVFGANRSPPLFAERVTPVVADITRLDEVRRLPAEFDCVVNAVSSNKGGVEAYRAVFLEGTRNLLQHVRCGKYVFTSSTSVYGQTDGSIVTEESAADAASATSRVLLETEALLKGVPAIILRVAGIYGPERGHLFVQYLRREAVIRGEGRRWLNMAHRDDVIGAIVAALEQSSPPAIYNVADNEPVQEAAFFDWLEGRLHRGFHPARVTESALPDRKRSVTNKRVSNEKIRSQLGYSFKYPTFREGYTAEIERLRAAGLLQSPSASDPK